MDPLNLPRSDWSPDAQNRIMGTEHQMASCIAQADVSHRTIQTQNRCTGNISLKKNNNNHSPISLHLLAQC